VHVWESLAILEYLAETVPAAKLWPQDKAARAHARAIANEMHAGFLPLRRHLPMNVRGNFTREITPEVQADIDRIGAIWREARHHYGAGGRYLFGDFTIADAMFAPVVSRFHTYAVAVSPVTRTYMDAVQALPAYKAWLADADAEPWHVARYDAV
jgi:glutathione S-transferase